MSAPIDRVVISTEFTISNMYTGIDLRTSHILNTIEFVSLNSIYNSNFRNGFRQGCELANSIFTDGIWKHFFIFPIDVDSLLKTIFLMDFLGKNSLIKEMFYTIIF